MCDIPKQNATDAPLAPADFGIEMNGVSFGYDADRRVIDDVSLRIPQGTSCAIVGPSGSGKTTLVNLMARFWDVDAGAVLLGGQDVRKGTAESLLAHVSMVFQNYALYPYMTVADNMGFALKIAGTPKDEIRKIGRAHV